MEFPDHKKSPNIDRISNLPMQVLDLILSYLPVRDIVRTSILSTNWRHKWVTVPNLVFGEGSCLSISESKALASIIYHVLLLHTGSIEVFEIKGIWGTPEIDRWVLHVCQRSIKELVLEFHSGLPRDPLQHFELGCCLCQCESLVKLNLSGCELSLPPCFEDFKRLKCLCLNNVLLTGHALDKLICSCPLLENLTILDCDQSNDSLKIDAQNLRYLEIRGWFCNVTFRHLMDRLLVFSLEHLTTHSSLNTSLAEILTKLPSIRQFVLNDGCLFYLSSGLTQENVPIQRSHLFHLSIFIDFNSWNECLAALYLFKCSPNLTELEIQACLLSSAVPGFWSDTGYCIWEFKKLRWVKMENFDISDIAGGGLEFVQFLLASSPVVEKLTLNPLSGCNVQVSWNNVKRMCEFRRASAEAKIIFDGHLVQ